MDELRAAFERSMKGRDAKNQTDQDYLLYGEYEPLRLPYPPAQPEVGHCLDNVFTHRRAGADLCRWGGRKRFGGFYDNTDIFTRMAEAMGLKKLLPQCLFPPAGLLWRRPPTRSDQQRISVGRAAGLCLLPDLFFMVVK